MAGYTRQSAGSIINGLPITAPPLDAEFNQVAAAFNATTGHGHTGGVGDAQPIALATSVSGYLPPDHGGVGGKNNFSSSSPISTNDTTEGYAVGSIWINTTTKQIFVCTANATNAANWHELVANTGTSLAPNVHNTVDIGTNAVRYKDFYLAGNADIDGTLNVLGNTILTTAQTTGQATLATVDINGGTIDGSVIGGTTPQAITGTLITANTGFSGALTGNVTGNLDGNVTGNLTGNVDGDLTGNVTAATGTTTLNDLIVNGTVDFTSTALINVSDPVSAQQASTKNYTDTADALKLNKAGGTMSGDITMGGNTVTGLGTPSADSDAATKGFVDTSIANVIDSAPASLDTLNELAAALGDDANFSQTVLTSLANRLSIFGGNVYGDISLGDHKATSTATPATDDTLTRKGYVDTQDALKLNLSGGTMSGAIAMGTAKITGVGDPTAAQDVSSKLYTDTQDALKLNLSGGTMAGNIVLGANKATSTATPTAADDLTRKAYVDGILGSSTSSASSSAAAAISEGNAATSAANAAISEGNASTSAANAAASYDDFDDRYLGAKSSAPTVDNDGDALVTGALYWDTTSNDLYVWSGSAWAQGAFTAGSVLSNVVEDTTPQLGGDLSSNGNDVLFGDNDKAIFGAVSDLQIYHDGTDSIIGFTNTHTGKISNITDNEDFITFTPNNAVQIYHDNSLKLSTTTTGVDITGILTSDGLTMGPNDKALFGTANEFQIYNDGTSSIITSAGGSTEPLKFQRTHTGSFIPTFTFEGVNDSFVGPFISLKHDTASPSNVDFSLISYDSKNDAAEDVTYAQIMFTTSNVADGAEEAQTIFKNKNSGSDKTLLVINGYNADVEIGDNGAVLLANGTTAQRPSTGQNGMLRYNTDDAQFEGYADGAWGAIAGGGGGDTQTVTTTSTTQTALGSYAAATSLGIEITVIATDTVATERTITKLLVTHDGTTAVATQYGEVNTATAVASYDVDISGSNVRLLATAASTNSTNFTAVASILA
jgi:hypothetical protein